MSDNDPDPIVSHVKRARRSGRFLVAVFRVEGNQMFLDRTAHDFPKADVDTALRMLVEDVQELKR